MGNSKSVERRPSSLKASLRPGSLHRKLSLVEHARQHSFAEGRGSDDSEKKNNENFQVDMMSSLQSKIEQLQERCDRLEAQNILVTVQQLDMLAQITALLLAAMLWIAYARLIFQILLSTDWTLRGVQHLADEIGVAFIKHLDFSKSRLIIPAWMVKIWVHKTTSWVVDRFFWVARTFGFWTLLIVLWALPYVYNRATYGSILRRFEVFTVFTIMVVRIRLCRWREHMFAADDEELEQAIWDANYEVSARFLYVSIRRLRGLWTKTAQYLSSRADFVPTAYIQELKKLQDEAPATPWDAIEHLLPDNIRESLVNIDPQPLASASIGQVHTAYLKQTQNDSHKTPTNNKVALKVQHPHARILLLDDFWSLAVILRLVTWLEPDYEFLAILLREWATEAKKELDFHNEAQNLHAACAAIAQKSFPAVVHAFDENGRKIPFSVEIPRPLNSLSNQDALVMTFCEGVRIDDLDKLEEWGLSRRAVVEAVTKTFAHMMYCTDIFNGDPHCGNLMVRPGTAQDSNTGFTIVLLDWGLAKRLGHQKRLAFCQMVYAASTFDYGLLMDSYKMIGLRMKREDTGRSMENMRFFLRDLTHRERARKRIKAKIKYDKERRKETKEARVPMQSKAYPGEFFFFVRVNELLHGLGSRLSVELSFLDILSAFAERGLRTSAAYDEMTVASPPPHVLDSVLQEKLLKVLSKIEQEGQLAGAQVCILDQSGRVLADAVKGNLGGLKSHIPMQRNALVLGFSCTKAIASTMAHMVVEKGYLSYDEPVCKRIWTAFCPEEKPPCHLEEALDISLEELQKRWHWKRQITLRHILTHKAGFWSALPAKFTIKSMASCEESFCAFEFNPDTPEDTLLPCRKPGEVCEYHFMSFGWLIAGALCGAYALEHGKKSATFHEVYQAVLLPKLSDETLKSGFRPMGGSGGFVLAQTTTSDIRASKILQMQREYQAMGEGDLADDNRNKPMFDALKSFAGKEFLLDPRVWNSADAIDACVPAAGGRFSARGLAYFYHDFGCGKLVQPETFEAVTSIQSAETILSQLQGVTRITNDGSNDRTTMGFGYNLIRFDKDAEGTHSAVGHAGVGGSIGFLHKPSGMAVGLMLNKADGGKDVTMRIMQVFADHFDL